MKLTRKQAKALGKKLLLDRNDDGDLWPPTTKPVTKKVNLAAVFAAWGLPPWVAEYQFHPKRKWRFDYAWPSLTRSTSMIWPAKVALEIDGGVWTRGRHVRGKGYLNDLEKLNRAAIMGWLVLRVTPEQMDNGEAFELIREALQARGWTP